MLFFWAREAKGVKYNERLKVFRLCSAAQFTGEKNVPTRVTRDLFLKRV